MSDRMTDEEFQRLDNAIYVGDKEGYLCSGEMIREARRARESEQRLTNLLLDVVGSRDEFFITYSWIKAAREAVGVKHE